MDTTGLVRALVGGALIGTAASLYLFTHGRPAGISGLLGGMLRKEGSDHEGRAGFLIGLVAAGVLLRILWPSAWGLAGASPGVPLIAVTAAGLLVGYGTRMGGGCTSGHGVCGISALSLRSIAATVIFMATGVLATFLVRHVWRAGS